MMSKNKKTLIFASVSFVSMSVFFQNCSLSKFNAGLGSSPSSSNNSAASVQPGFIAPVSTSGVSVAITLPATGEKVIIAKEYRHKVFDRYFITTRTADQKIVEPGGLLGADWESTSNTYSLYESQIAGSSPLCRFYISTTKTHFYTADVNECSQFKATAGFNYEGIEGYAIKINPGAVCPGTTKPVYRAYSNSSINEQKRHRYSGSASVIAGLVSQSWQDEGISFCAADLYFASTVVTPPPVYVPPAGSCTKPVRYINAINDPCEDFGPYPPDLSAYCACRYTTTPPSPPAGAHCSLNGTTVLDGASVTAYQSATVPSGSTCSSQIRTCTNGNLSGTFSYNTCSVGSAVVNPNPPPPSPPVSSAQCPNDYLFYDWGTIGVLRSTDTSSRDLNGNNHLFGAKTMVVIKMTVTANMTTVGKVNLPKLWFFEEPSFPESIKEAVISRSPCNFQNPEFVISKASDYNQGLWAWLRINESQQRFSTVGSTADKINLTTGVWYYTIRNVETEALNGKFNIRASVIP